jgi:hypothetical protein
MIRLRCETPRTVYYDGHNYAPTAERLENGMLRTAIALNMPDNAILNHAERKTWISTTLDREALTPSTNRSVYIEPLDAEKYTEYLGNFFYYAGGEQAVEDTFENSEQLNTTGLLMVFTCSQENVFYAIGRTLDQLAHKNPLLPLALLRSADLVSPVSGISSPWSIYADGEDLTPFFYEELEENEPTWEDLISKDLHWSLKPYTGMTYEQLSQLTGSVQIPAEYGKPIRRLQVLYKEMMCLDSDIAVAPYSNLPTLILTGDYTDEQAGASRHRQLVDEAANDLAQMGGDSSAISLSIVPERNLRAYLRVIKQAEMCSEDLANSLVEGGL